MICPLFAQDTGEQADFGRLRYYFRAGALLSNGREDFSKTNLFMGLSLDKNYYQSNRVLVNTYFDTRLTAISVSSFDNFLDTRKAAALEIGFYMPVITTRWAGSDGDYSLFAAPIAKGGFLTPTGSDEAVIVNPNKFFTYYEFGGRLGHFREFQKSGQAPELLSSVDFTVGRFGNFETYRDQSAVLRSQHLLGPDDLTPAYVRRRLYRLDVEGMLTIPSTPFVVGFHANVALGRQHEPGFSMVKDDLQFLFGARFDARRLVQKLSELH